MIINAILFRNIISIVSLHAEFEKQKPPSETDGTENLITFW